ncbi:Ff.00g027910.m01.CDS01 [Fusarium sp. VM40]|nr:Ff.00g027910.m01.CDS01 [Fusarium sp. VM40]
MSPLVSRVARAGVALRPLPAVHRGLRTSSIRRAAEPYEAKTPKDPQNHNKILGAGAVLIGATFLWFYTGGKTKNLDPSGESTGIKVPK